MATVASGGPISDPKPIPKPSAQADKGGKKAPEPAQATKGDGGSEPSKKSTAAELKAKKQAEKAARRAQAIAAKAAAGGGAATESSSQPPHSVSEQKGGKTKARQDGQPVSASAAAGRSGHGGKLAAGGGPKPAEKEKDARASTAACFAHLPVPKRISVDQADKDVHPAVLALGQQMAAFTLRENIARLKGTLEAFKQVLQSYEAPSGNAFQRHFVPHVLNPQIDYLTECRPMCYAMGNAIRLIKTRVGDLDVETSDKQAIKTLCKVIDTFVQERIYYAEVVITRNAAAMILDGDVVLTYGYHRLVRNAIQQAWSDGKRFEVVIVEDQSDREGRQLAKLLRGEGVAVTYFPELVELGSVLRRGSKVLLGVEGVFANGAIYASAGTSDIAAAASDREVPVIALCESINVDRDRVAVDSLAYNEIDPDRSTEGGSRLLFDTTKAQHISVLVTEYETVTGNAPAAAVLAILRKQDDPN